MFYRGWGRNVPLADPKVMPPTAEKDKKGYYFDPEGIAFVSYVQWIQDEYCHTAEPVKCLWYPDGSLRILFERGDPSVIGGALDLFK